MTRHISRDQTIAGVSLLDVRRFFRRVGLRAVDRDDLAEALPGLARPVRNRLWQALLTEGYIEFGRLEGEPERRNRWMLSDKGLELLRATAATTITRKTADRLLATTLDRADQMRADRLRFAYTPARLYVYGSYLTDKERLGDLDVAVEWEPRYSDRDAQLAYNLAFAQEASAAGRQFGNYVQYLCWGMDHAQLFLRNRARALSLNSIEFPEQREHIIYEVPHCLVYEHGERLPIPSQFPAAAAGAASRDRRR